MNNSVILDELVAASAHRARQDAKVESLSALRRRVLRLPTARRLEATLRYSKQLTLIAEIKRSSPSEGRFASVVDGAQAAGELAKEYVAAGAGALSILTEPTRFAGSDRDLVAATTAGVPVLRKDFLVTPYQLWQARAHGADAALLIARCLPGELLTQMIEAAGEAGLDALVEVHDEEELERALAADATLVGVNARDLATLNIDLAAAFRLLELGRSANVTLVAESGLSTTDDLRQAAEAGAHAALIGTAFLRTPNPAAAAARLILDMPSPPRPLTPPPVHPARVLVKVCGLRTVAAVRAAATADADFAGFIVAERSPRAVSPQKARELASHLSGGPKPVLVFHVPSEEEVKQAVLGANISSIQLSGFEAPPAWLADLANDLDEVIGVIHRPDSAISARGLAEAWFNAGATRVLLEGATAARGGGSGESVSRKLAARLNRLLPLGLAGGLKPSSVAKLVGQVRPALVDAAGGLERTGKTSPARLVSFVRNARRDVTGADQVDAHGRYGQYGGRYVPETLMPAVEELEAAWSAAHADPNYRSELARLSEQFIGRATPIFEIPREALAKYLSLAPGEPVARVFLKREDLAHTGAHKINNALGQALLAKRLDKPRVIAETGAGQHGVATATACALLDLECVVYMGTTDIERQAPNVQRMALLGAEVRPVASGNGTLRDALNEALRDWVTNVETTFYVLGSAAGPHPYPQMVAELQSVIGREAREQMLNRTGRLPDVLLACVGGGSNAIGLFAPFLDSAARLVGVEAGGRGDDLGDNAASLGLGSPGVLHGALTMLTQTSQGQVVEPHSVSAGLDYPGVGPQLAALADSGRLEVQRATDDEAIAALRWLSRACGIIPALESAHAVAAALRMLPGLDPDAHVLINLSGRGDKDLGIMAQQAPESER